MNDMNAITKWMQGNPEAFNMGLGLLKGMQEDKRNAALSEAEVAKTQYGYLTGAGTGNIKNLGMNNTGDRVMQGAITGAVQRRDSDFSNKLLEAIAAKKGGAPDRSPASLKGGDLDTQNPAHKLMMDPNNMGDSVDSTVPYNKERLTKALNTIGANDANSNYVSNSAQGDGGLPQIYQEVDSDLMPMGMGDTKENVDYRQYNLDQAGINKQKNQQRFNDEALRLSRSRFSGLRN